MISVLMMTYMLHLFTSQFFLISGDASSCSSPDAVQKVRQQIIENMDLWLSECQGTLSGQSYSV